MKKLNKDVDALKGKKGVAKEETKKAAKDETKKASKEETKKSSKTVPGHDY
jgi:hypothetical protein